MTGMTGVPQRGLHYDPAIGAYTARVPAGTAAFRRVVTPAFGFRTSQVVRDASRCREQRSEHCECRAVDEFTGDLAVGRRFFDWCVLVAAQLGVQSVIYRWRVWGFGDWHERAYHGPNPHLDHVHVGLTRNAAATLTDAEVRGLLPAGGGVLPHPRQEVEMLNVKQGDEAAIALPPVKGVLYIASDFGANVRLAIGRAGAERIETFDIGQGCRPFPFSSTAGVASLLVSRSPLTGADRLAVVGVTVVYG